MKITIELDSLAELQELKTLLDSGALIDQGRAEEGPQAGWHDCITARACQQLMDIGSLY